MKAVAVKSMAYFDIFQVALFVSLGIKLNENVILQNSIMINIYLIHS